MATARTEWITLGVGALADGTAANVLRSAVGTPQLVAVTGTATPAGQRPQAPATGGGLFARVSAVDGHIVTAWGADPTAAQNNGILVMSGAVELIPVTGGDKLSFIELDLD